MAKKTLKIAVLAGMAALGLLLTASSIGLAWIDRPRMPEIWKLSLAEGGLWTAVGAYLLTDSGILMRSVRSTAENVLTHIGGWGSFLLLFGVGGLLALILLRREALLAIRFPLTGFIPLVILLAYLREGAYRVGPGDSLNRMWIHVLPLAILFVAISAANRPRLRGLGRVAAASGAPTKEQTSTHLRR